MYPKHYRFLSFGLVFVFTIALLIIFPLPRLIAAPPASNYYEINIDEIQDTQPTSGCTLREALGIANTSGTTSANQCAVTQIGSASSTYVINMPSFTYTLNPITPTGGDLDITANTVYMVGNNTIIQASSVAPTDPATGGQAVDRVLYVGPLATVEISNTTIRHGVCDVTVPCTTHGDTFGGNSGGGILNHGNLTLLNVTVDKNHADFTSGGIMNTGASATLSVMNSTFSNNFAGASVGAIYNFNGATITLISGSTFSNNRANTGNAGAIQNENDTTAIDTIVNSTFSGNFANSGGGAIRNKSGATIINIANSTFAGNTATDGGGIFNQGTITSLTHNILYGNTSNDCETTATDTISEHTFNLIGADDGTNPCDTGGDVTTSNPGLGALADNGGPTETLATSSSPPVNSGDATCPAAANGVDQRGAARSGICDIGAYEASGTAPAVAFSVDNLTISEEGAPTVATVTVTGLNYTAGDDIVALFRVGGTATETTDYTVSATQVTLTPASGPQTFTVTALPDLVADASETVELTMILLGSADASAPIQQTITIVEPATFSINDLTVAEGSGGAASNVSFTVTRAGNTATAVSVDYSTADNTATAPSDYTAVPATTVNFAATETSKQVTVSVIGDDMVESDETFFVNLSNPNGGAITDSQGEATITDDDTVGVIVDPTNGLITTEAGGTATFDVVLNSQPNGNVVIAVASGNLAEGTVSAPTLTFDGTNWNVAQTVTITGQDDTAVDGNVPYNIVLSIHGSTTDTTGYTTLNPADVSVTNTDNDVPSILVLPAAVTTSETGTTATFNVSLNVEPTADVTVDITGLDATEGSLNIAQLTFTMANFATVQTVTVTGVDDSVVDGNVQYTLTLTGTSTDTRFDNVTSAVDVTNVDNDTAAINVSAISGNTTEAGGTATFTVVLVSEPTADVTVNLSSSDTSEGTVSPASVVFNATNWNVPQTVTVTGVDDADDDGDIAYTIITAAAVSTDMNYSGINAADVNVTNVDNDDPVDICPAPQPGDPPLRPAITFARPATDGQYRILLWNATAQLLMFDLTETLNNLCDATICTINPDATMLPFGLIDGEHDVYVQLQPDGEWEVAASFTIDETPPVAPGNLTVNRNQGRPSITFSHDPNALYYQVFAMNADTLEQIHLQWYEKTPQMCCGTECELLLDMFVPAGNYTIFVQAWGPGGVSTGGIQDLGWAGPANVDLNFDAPQAVTNLQAATAGNEATLTWTGAAGATFYQVWVGTISPVSTAYLEWKSAVDLGCANQGTCTLLPGIAFTSGTTYNWYVLGYGPGGTSVGGVAEGWAEGTPFTP